VRLQAVSALIGIELLDHLIIGETQFYSVREHGVL
jgi:DNA repair protein RadC